MDRCALFVDAGVVLADGAMAVHGTRRRESVSWDYSGLLRLLSKIASERSGLPLLRCYWYDAAIDGRRTSDHDALAELPGLKLRLGRMRPGRREGVDAEVHRDLSTLAHNHAIADAVIVSAEEDLARVIADVQDLGVRVTLVQVAADGRWQASPVLRQECDAVIEVDAAELRPHVRVLAASEPAQIPAGHSVAPYLGAPVANGHAVVGAHGAHHAPLSERQGAGAIYPPPAAAPEPAHVPRPGQPAVASPQKPAVDLTAADNYASPAVQQGPGDQEPTRAESAAVSDGASPGVRSPAAGQAPVSAGQASVSAGQASVSAGQASVSAGQASVSAGQASVSAGQAPVGHEEPVGQQIPVGQAIAGLPAQAAQAPPSGQLARRDVKARSSSATPGQALAGPASLALQGAPSQATSGLRPHTSSSLGPHTLSAPAPAAPRAAAAPVAPVAPRAASAPAAPSAALAPAAPPAAPAGSAPPQPETLGDDASQHQNALQQQQAPHEPQLPQRNQSPQPQEAQRGTAQEVQRGTAQDQPVQPQLYAAPTPGLAAPAPGLAAPAPGLAAPPPVTVAPASSAPGRRAIPSDPQPPTARTAPAAPPLRAAPPLPAEQAVAGIGPDGPGTSPAPYAPPQPPYTAPQAPTATLADATAAAHAEGVEFGDSVAREAPALWLEAVLARKPRMPSDLEARLLQGSSLPIDFLLHDEVRHALRRGFWDALERARR